MNANERAGERAAAEAWRDAGMPIASPALASVPACRDCGHVPTTYSRFSDGSVQCAADELRACYARQDETL